MLVLIQENPSFFVFVFNLIAVFNQVIVWRLRCAIDADFSVLKNVILYQFTKISSTED